ncbi:MAG TPA: DUF6526 family protein [Bryobacteraceae bacterium]|nr:DUF6526 family protein [Bryobacteraceae bacterium]
MAEKKPQTLQNHARIDPLFHLFLSPVALILLIAAAYNLYANPSWKSGAFLLGAVAAFVALFKIRLYALKVQDRVIRLEERLRLERLLSEPLKSRIYELTEQQLIALRFASDGELPALVEKTLKGNLPPKEIKQAIQSWRPDYWRV